MQKNTNYFLFVNIEVNSRSKISDNTIVRL